MMAKPVLDYLETSSPRCLLCCWAYTGGADILLYTRGTDMGFTAAYGPLGDQNFERVKETRKGGYLAKKQNEETGTMKNKGEETQHPTPWWHCLEL